MLITDPISFIIRFHKVAGMWCDCVEGKFPDLKTLMLFMLLFGLWSPLLSLSSLSVLSWPCWLSLLSSLSSLFSSSSSLALLFSPPTPSFLLNVEISRSNRLAALAILSALSFWHFCLVRFTCNNRIIVISWLPYAACWLEVFWGVQRILC